MITATFCRKAHGWTGDARVYRLSEPVKTCEEGIVTEYVIVSAVDVPFSGTETYIFPAVKEGEVIDWGELPGSLKGTLLHEDAIKAAGWRLKGETA